ncbi:hypothetical protein GP486_008211 [Trichoglossum hirsutum]|uniref:Acyltransferase 3 domain-containing protein n=1 Tax=Trichoglossum hirsutum TaxID=265104 RepID=A0A9P8IEH6_9PEZI|nr:hypothetical protein GP486_008211 [Trichoglossum hirsutum]
MRLPVQGPSWVIMFVVLSAYAAAVKPVKLSRLGKAEEALSSLASSSFRRTGRLVLPSLAATILSWFLCQIGAYNIGKSSDAWWISETSRNPSRSWAAAFTDLIDGIIQTWADGENPYDQPQWTLPVLLKASMFTYMLLLATAQAQPSRRMLIVSGFYVYSWRCQDCKCCPASLGEERENIKWTQGVCGWRTDTFSDLVGTNVAAGILLAELSQHPITHRLSSHSSYGSIPPILLFLSGLYCCSFPEHHPDWSPWFFPLYEFGAKHFPAGAEISRNWNLVGAHLVIVGVVFSQHLMRALSHPIFLFLGGISFPLYLLQGPTIRSVLSWVLFGFASPVTLEEALEGGDVLIKSVRPIPSTWIVCVVLVFYFGFLFWVSNLWSTYVDPYFAWVTQQMEVYVFFRNREGTSVAGHHKREDGVMGLNGHVLPK